MSVKTAVKVKAKPLLPSALLPSMKVIANATQIKLDFVPIPDVDDAPVWKLINPKLVKVDWIYQRDEDLALVKKLVKNFNWLAFGAPIVVLRKGKYYVLDGQHRISAALERGAKLIPVLVAQESMTVAEEALAFLGINTIRKNMHATAIHKAKAGAGDVRACEIEKAVESLGLKVSKQQGWDNVACIQTLNTIWDNGGYGLVLDVLTLANKAWYGQPKSFNDRVLRYLAEFLYRYCDKLEWKDLTKAFDAAKTSTPFSSSNILIRVDKGLDHTNFKAADWISEYLLMFNKLAGKKLQKGYEHAGSYKQLSA